MDAMEYELVESLLKRAPASPLFKVCELQDQEDRTLFYGYTTDRAMWHVYLKNGQIYRKVYGGENKVNERICFNTSAPAADLIPNKRLYPAACDLEATKLMIKLAVHLPFTTYEERTTEQFYGEL